MITLIRKIESKPQAAFMLLVLLLCLILFSRYLFCGWVYLFTDIGADTIDQYYPFLYFNSTLYKGPFSWYSFKLGAGASILNLNHHLFDPFSIVLYLLPIERLSSGIVYTIILKILFVAWFTYKFLKELFPKAEELVWQTGAMAIAFCGFFILWGQHYFLSSTFAWFPLLLYGFELLLKGKKGMIYLVAMALLAMSFFAFYQVSFFFAFYLVIRIFFGGQFPNSRERILFIGKKLIPLSIAGIGLTAFRFFPSFTELTESPRISGDSMGWLQYVRWSSIEYLGTTVMRMFSNNYWGCGGGYTGFLNYYESPQLYSSLLMLLMVPQALLAKDKRYRPLVVFLLLFLTGLFVTPVLSVVLNGFQYPSYRWGMLASMSIVLLGTIGLISYIQSVSRLKKGVLLFTGLFYLIVVLVPVFHLPHIDFRLPVLKIVLLLGFYLTALLLLPGKKRWMAAIVMFLFVFDLVAEHHATINDRQSLKKEIAQSGEYYFDGNIEIVDEIMKKDPLFYRIVKSSYSRFLDDPMVQGYNGLTSYNSINDPSYIRFLKKANVPFYHPGNVSYITQYDDRQVLYDLLSVKYLLSDAYTGDENLFYANEKQHRYVYRRSNALPIGFTYDSYLLEDRIGNYSDSLLLRTVILDQQPDIEIDEYSPAAYKPALQQSEQIASAGATNLLYTSLRKDTLTITHFEDDFIKGTVDLEENKLLFLSIPYNKGWTIRCNGKKVKPLLANFGFMALPLEKGINAVELRFFPAPMKAGLWVSGATLLMIMIYVFRRRLMKLIHPSRSIGRDD